MSNKAWIDIKGFIKDCLNLFVMVFGKPLTKSCQPLKKSYQMININGLCFWVLTEYLVNDGVGYIHVHYVHQHKIICTRSINVNKLAVIKTIEENPFSDIDENYRKRFQIPNNKKHVKE